MRNKNSEPKAIAMRVSINTIIVNAVLSGFKLLAGIISGSAAMISDAVHSASDVFSTIIVMVGVHISAKDADTEHPYGHERMECVAAILLACVLALTGLVIGYSGIQSLISSTQSPLAAPGLLALIAAIISIAVKEGMYWYTRNAAKKINSGALMADAWHHRSDAFSSVGSLIGIAGARLGLPILDPIAAIAICIFILKASYDIFKDGIDKMVDKACPEEVVAPIRELVLQVDGVVDIDLMKTRMFGARYYVDIEITADGSLTLSEAHHIAETVHAEIEHHFPDVKHCMVHVNPAHD